MHEVLNEGELVLPLGIVEANFRLFEDEVEPTEDKVLKDIVQNGWTFTIVPWTAEKIWPSLPDLAQSALNAEHSTFSVPSELQAMAMIAIHAGNGDKLD